jgi:hypothetical protein
VTVLFALRIVFLALLLGVVAGLVAMALGREPR